jgi:tetratricopeptide (TPR) repeat protein
MKHFIIWPAAALAAFVSFMASISQILPWFGITPEKFNQARPQWVPTAVWNVPVPSFEQTLKEGIADAQNRDFARAIQNYTVALEIADVPGKRRADAFEKLSYAYYRTSQFKAGIEAAKAGIALDPDNMDAWLNELKNQCSGWGKQEETIIQNEFRQMRIRFGRISDREMYRACKRADIAFTE